MTMQAVKKLWNEMRQLKVKEVPGYIKPKLSKDYIRERLYQAMEEYHAKYIQTSSIKPFNHAVYTLTAISYLVALPEERRHLEHQQHAH
ncbi:hypothetical protein SUGI_0379060 [Cryptomeria japonica]|nr:hypothetical protein SUGI_0379060 [Cryptomeria japonica]